MAGERRRCRLKIAEEEILLASPEVRGRRLLPRGSWAGILPAPLPGKTLMQSFLLHVLISPSSCSSSVGSVGTTLPSRGGEEEAVFHQTWPGKGRKHVCRELRAVVSACRLRLLAHSEAAATDISAHLFSQMISTSTYIYVCQWYNMHPVNR